MQRSDEAYLRALWILTAFVTLGTVPTLPQQAQSPVRIPAESSGQFSDIEVTEAYPGLLQRARVVPAVAVDAALAKVKHGELEEVRIEERGRRLVYVIRIQAPGKQARELLVDADTGRVLSNRKLPRNQPRGT
jgi:Peptidase propeptide and YPEB domain